MGGILENGNGEIDMSDVPFSAKKSYKYEKMTTLTEYGDDGGNNVDGSDSGSQHYHHHHQLEKRRLSTRTYVFACAIFACLINALLGYDVGVMSGAIIFIREDLKLTEVQLEVLVGILSIISLFGSLAGGRTSDAFGRKWTMGFAAIIFQVGVAIMCIAPSFQVLMVGRLLAGIGIGFGVMIAPVYIAEISPTASRGTLTSFPEIFINIGILLGYVSNYAFSGLPVHINWRIMLGVGILPSVFIILALCIIPESPRWLVVQNRIDEARSVLLKTNDNDAEAEERLSEIQLAAGFTDSEKPEEKSVWRELLSPSPALGKMLVTGIGIQCFQQITGIDATVYYSPEIFQAAGLKGNSTLLAATVAVGVAKTAFIVVAMVLVDKVGRKPLLYVSTVGMTICLLMVGFTLAFMGTGSVAIALVILSVCGNVAFFSIGMGPICWVLTSEIFPLKFRAQASAVATLGNRICSGLISMTFLSVSRALTVGGTFFIFGVISAISVVFVYMYVPETKGKSLEQIEMMFQDGYELQGSEVQQLGDAERLVMP